MAQRQDRPSARVHQRQPERLRNIETIKCVHAADLLDEIFAIGFLGFVRRFQGTLHFSLDFLPQGCDEFNIDIGFEQSGSDFLECSVENLRMSGRSTLSLTARRQVETDFLVDDGRPVQRRERSVEFAPQVC